MLLLLTDFSDIPLHQQIYSQLTDKILDGRLPDHTLLPGPRIIARDHHVGVNTVRRAYEALARDGLINKSADSNFTVAVLSPDQKKAIAAKQRLGSGSPLNAVESFSKQLISVFDPEKLMAILSDNLKTYISAKEVHFCLYNERVNEYFLTTPETESGKISFPTDDPLIAILAQSKSIVKTGTLPANVTVSALAREIAEKKIKIIIPLHEEGGLAGFLGLSSKMEDQPYKGDEYDLMMILANQFVTALTTARFYVEAVERRRLQQELEMAKKIQADLLPGKKIDDDVFTISGYSEPSRDIGGDFYDVVRLRKHEIGVTIGDACGKGLAAALLASQAQATAASEMRHAASLAEAMRNVNRHVHSATTPDTFVTLFAAVFNRKTLQVTYCSAGHHHPFLLHKDRGAERLGRGGPGLGLIKDAEYETGLVQLRSGDKVVLFTDGFNETMDEKRNEYGEDRLLKTLQECQDQKNDDMIDIVISDLQKFVKYDVPQDDRTMVVVSC